MIKNISYLNNYAYSVDCHKFSEQGISFLFNIQYIYSDICKTKLHCHESQPAVVEIVCDVMNKLNSSDFFGLRNSTSQD